jgi:hypothetical protein
MQFIYYTHTNRREVWWLIESAGHKRPGQLVMDIYCKDGAEDKTAGRIESTKQDKTSHLTGISHHRSCLKTTNGCNRMAVGRRPSAPRCSLGAPLTSCRGAALDLPWLWWPSRWITWWREFGESGVKTPVENVLFPRRFWVGATALEVPGKIFRKPWAWRETLKGIR